MFHGQIACIIYEIMLNLVGELDDGGNAYGGKSYCSSCLVTTLPSIIMTILNFLMLGVYTIWLWSAWGWRFRGIDQRIGILGIFLISGLVSAMLLNP